MKKLYLLLSIALLSNYVYCQVTVQVVACADNRYAFIAKATKQKVNTLTWDETEPFVNGFAKVAANNKWGFVDKNGTPIINSFYTDVRNFVNRLAAVNDKNKWGFIDEQGKVVIPFEYDIVYDFTEHVTAVYKNEKWFLINKQAAIIKPLDIDVFYGFKNGRARITKQGRNGFINMQGDIISLEVSTKATINNNFSARPNSASSVPCPVNIGFEYGNFTNWLCDTGFVAGVGTSNVITLFPSTPTANRHVIIPTANPSALDPYGLFPTNAPDGSNFALKLGNNINGKGAERVSYEIVVPTNSVDASITYRYAVVFEDPGHLYHEQPRFITKLLDVATNTYVPCASYEYISDAALPGFFNSPIDATVKCKAWSSVFVNLSAYAGKTMRLEFTTADCTRGLHWGYAYVDVGDCNITASVNYTCNPSAANLIAPAGFQFYNWWNSNYTAILATGQNATISPIPANNSTLHVEVIPFNGFGCQDTLHVLINNNNAIADAGPDKFICPLGTTTIGTAPVAGNTYSWSPTNGLSNPNIATPTASPLATTTYYLSVNNPTSNCPAIDSVVVTVYPKPIASFTTPAPQCIFNNNFSFVNTSTGAASYLWYFGDGTTSTATSPTHSYATANAFTVKLVVTSANGCKDSVSSVINVYAKPIAAFITPASQCISNNNFSFVNTSTGAASYLWHFGDGTTSSATSPNHSYATANTFTVKLIVTSSNGCTDSLSRTINIYPKPTASFTTPAPQCFFNNNFSFVNTSIGAASYLWYFGDGTTSTATSPTHSYATANTFTVKLVVTSVNGCKDSVSRIINVFPKPTASFTTPAPQCFSNNNFSFVNTSTGGTSYLWYFGDGTTSTATNPTHGYTSANAFTVKLVVTSANGCKDSVSKIINVFPKPTPLFTTPAPQCFSNNNFSFVNTSTGAASYLWYFGDGTTSIATSPAHSYTTANTFTVKLIVTSANGCKDSVSRIINVYPKPTAAFTAPAPQCFSNNNFSFVNTSTGAASYMWYFGDGATSTATSPTHSYATANTFTVKLVVTSANGCKDSVSRIINVYPKPTAAFTAPAPQCFSNNNFSFANTSTGGASYLWYFGDGATSTATSPTHSYATANTFTVKLVVTSANGCKDSASRIINVYPKPIASFTTPAPQCFSNNNFSFANTSTGAVSYLWHFGDGTTSSLQNPSHSYAAANAFTVKLVVTSANGCKDSVSRIINVYPKPTPSFTAPAPQCFSNNNFSFVNTSTSGSTYIWYFGDGTTSTATSPTHSYATANTFTVKLIVTSSNGCKDSLSRTINVYPKPTPSFTTPAPQCFSNNNFSFTNTSTGAANYLWYFGDGTTSTASSPTHSYATANTFTVKLIVTNSNGCKDSVTNIVNVYPKPTPAFTTATPQCFSTNNFTFTNTSTGGATYLWFFGDGSTSSATNPIHVYANANAFTVKLIVTSINGCKDSISRLINVYSNPIASFIAPASQCIFNNNFSFVNTSVGTATYLWSFGDGTTSTAQNPTHSYTIANAFTVKLVVTNSNGCKDSITSIVNVYAKPIPAFTTPSPQCFSNNNFIFNNNSVGASTYLWNFGDGNTSIDQVPTHSYATAGNYTTKLMVTNNYGCADSTSDVTNVLAVPTPAFIAPAAQCILNNNFIFTNISTGGATYLWYFGDGTSSTLPAPTHSYTNANTYTVKLIVTNSNGCWDTISNVVNVNPGATLLMGNDPAICKGRNTLLSIQGAQTYQWTPSTGLNCDTCANPIATPDSTTTYTVTALTNGGCPGADTVRVTVFQPIDINVSPNKQICTNESFRLSASGASTYLWSPAQGLNSTTSANPTTTTTSTIQYMVVGFDNHNCFKDTGYVKITILPKPTLQLGADQTVSTGTVVPLTAATTNGPIVSWLWTPATDLSCNTCPRPMATIKKDITYTATVKNIHGCVATDDIHFHTICEGSQVYVPNAFTPDGDGKNDILMIRSKGIEVVRSFKIYSRWGELIFEQNNFPPNNPTYGWDGKIKGVVGSAEVYVYVAQVTCDNVKDFIIKGNISILK
jgi:gliding motility-associated-like protein